MASKHDFLDPTRPHTLTDQECKLISLFRELTKSQKLAVTQAVMQLLLNDKRFDKKPPTSEEVPE